MRPSALNLVLIFAALLLVPCERSWAQAEESAALLNESEFQEALEDNCVYCHSQQDAAGEVSLSGLNLKGIAADFELFAQMYKALDFREMPPETEGELDSKLRLQLLATLKNKLTHAHSGHSSNKFRPTPIRRMTRLQYNNAVVDLFDLKCIVFTLPERMMRDHSRYFQPARGKMPDKVKVGSRPLGKSQLIERRLAGVAAFPQDRRAEHGFDNRADHLSLSPLLLESFLALGQSITNSPDFNPKNVGLWKKIFAPPANLSNLDEAGISLAVRERIAPFLRRAFRQTPTDEVVDRYSQFVTSQLASGADFQSAMKMVASAVIASPRFIYLYDKGNSLSNGEHAKQIDDFELASRLSFFLWGSIPDEELLDLAEKRLLHEPAQLAQQLERMLKSTKLKRFCDSFPSQWLQLERIISSVPARDKFPNFYFSKYRDSMHMMLEPLLIFETVLIENLSITQFIQSDFTYRSALLEDAYGQLATAGVRKGGGAVGAIEFRRVPVTDPRSGGLITNAAVMTMTSGPERTQPITRGAWLATVVFNNPPKPPPADVPPLEEKPSAGEEDLTLRERLNLHRERADCNGCHQRIDPLGFALENFDPVGRWRETYDNGRQIDMEGSLFRTMEFSSVAEFKNAILAEEEHFVRGFVEHLMSYALARELDSRDTMDVLSIVDEAAADNYRLQTIIKAIVMSQAFQSKSNSQADVAKVTTRN